LRRVKERIAEEVRAFKSRQRQSLKMLNEEMELLGKAEMNNIVTRNIYRAGVDTLANAILNDLRFLTMLMTSVLNEYLAK